MKILGISFGSKNGNNDAMCKEALIGAKEKGAEIEFVNMQNLHIEHCNGCTSCVLSLMSGKGGKCVLKDDFEWLKEKMMEADGIVCAVPIFEDGASGLFHTIVDRFGPRHDRAMNIIGTQIAEATGGKAPDPRIQKDKVISFMSIGGSDWFTRAQTECATLAMTPAWKVINNEVFPWSKCIAMEDEKLAVARKVGHNIAEAAADIEAASWKGEAGMCPHCHNRNFYLADDATKAICCFCGLIGEIKVTDGKVSFTFPAETEGLAHDTISGKFKHADDIKENEGKLMEWKKTDAYKTRMKYYKDFIESSKPERE